MRELFDNARRALAALQDGSNQHEVDRASVLLDLIEKRCHVAKLHLGIAQQNTEEAIGALEGDHDA